MVFIRIRCAIVALALCSIALTPGSALAEPRTPDAARAQQALDNADVKAAQAILDRRDARLSPADRHLIKGRIHLLQKKHASARRSVQAAIKLKPRHAESHYWLARVYQADSAHALASSSFEKAYELGMGSCDLHMHWAISLRACEMTFGEIQQRCWKDRMNWAPTLGSFELDGIVVQQIRGRPDWVLVAPPRSAVYQIHKAIAADSKRADALLLCGEIWAEISQHEMAVRSFQRAAKALDGPALARCYGAWAASSLALGRLDSYVKHTREQMQLVGELSPDRLASCYDKAAHEASARGDLKKQIRYLTLAAETMQTPSRLIELADALLLAQRPADAHHYLTRALDGKPSRSERAEIRQRLTRTTYLASPEMQR